MRQSDCIRVRSHIAIHSRNQRGTPPWSSVQRYWVFAVQIVRQLKMGKSMSLPKNPNRFISFAIHFIRYLKIMESDCVIIVWPLCLQIIEKSTWDFEEEKKLLEKKKPSCSFPLFRFPTDQIPGLWPLATQLSFVYRKFVAYQKKCCTW